MSEYPWYDLAEGDDLQQGDLLFGCPFDQVDETGQPRRKDFDVAVLSQSCDLVHDKLELVQVCPFWSLDELGRRVEYFRTKRGREELRRGNLPGYHLRLCAKFVDQLAAKPKQCNTRRRKFSKFVMPYARHKIERRP